MTDKKSVASIIKTLERTIGVLENCSDLGEFPDATRKRIIEMLNTATLGVYFLDNGQENNPLDEKKSGTEVVSEKEPEVILSKTIEETVLKEDVSKENIPEIIPEPVIIQKPVIVPEPVVIVPEPVIIPEPVVIVPEKIAEKTSKDEILIDEKILESISEESIFQQSPLYSDKPIIEWEPEPEPEPVQETQAPSKDEEINLLKSQLEGERRRLELELQNWQDEKRKRDDEMLATKKLLEALQQQTQTQAQQIQLPKPEPVVPAKPEPIIKEEIIREPVRRNEPQESQGTLSDSFIGSKKVLYENFETNDMVNKISTPVSSLQKAIGINDKFRFIKELFGGDSDVYTETIGRLDTIGSLVSALSYIESTFSWDKNSDSVKQLISLIRRRYM
jgi:hypothetical protein